MRITGNAVETVALADSARSLHRTAAAHERRAVGCPRDTARFGKDGSERHLLLVVLAERIACEQHARSVVEFIRADAAKFAKIIKATGAKIE